MAPDISVQKEMPSSQSVNELMVKLKFKKRETAKMKKKNRRDVVLDLRGEGGEEAGDDKGGEQHLEYLKRR